MSMVVVCIRTGSSEIFWNDNTLLLINSMILSMTRNLYSVGGLSIKQFSVSKPGTMSSRPSSHVHLGRG